MQSLLKLGISATAAVFATACGKPPVDNLRLQQSPWENWIMFDESQSNMPLGAGYGLAGGVQTTCYKFDSAAAGGASADKYTLTWSRNQNASLGLSISRVLGLETEARRAERGRIEFDSLFTKRAENIAPVFGCADAASDFLPRLPAMSALLGAKKFTLVLTDSSGASLTAVADSALRSRIRANLSGSQVTANGLEVSFSSPQFIAAQFEGWEAKAASETTTATAKFGQSVVLDPYSITVERADTSAGTYRIVVSTFAGTTRVDTAIARDNAGFLFGRRAGDAMAGAYHTAVLYVSKTSDPSDEWMITLRTYSPTHQLWSRAEQRDSLKGWIRGRGR